MLLAAGFVLLAGGHVVRNMLVDQDALPSGIMEDVGKAAARGEAPSQKTIANVHRLAVERPLDWEPFLVQGAIALKDGDYALAERLILGARQRAPRSPAARFLLAEAYLQTNRPVQAMREMAVLNRLVPAASAQLAPALAEYARAPGAVEQIRTILESYPELETPLLAKLSWDPRNADLILRLATSKPSSGPPPDWQRLLLTTLVNDRQYERAYGIWRRLARSPDLRGGFYNPTFADKTAPAPFNWQLAQGAGGVAEPGSGGLQVLYFGRDNVELASQVLLLAPGRYRLEASASGNLASDSGVSWKGTCLSNQRSIFTLPLGGSGPFSGEFQVPPDCGAQRVALAADAPAVPQSADFRISGLRLTRIAS